MAVFTIASGQTLRMDKLFESTTSPGPISAGPSVNIDGHFVLDAFDYSTNPAAFLYSVWSTSPITSLPFAGGGDYYLGNLTVDLSFYDAAAGVDVGTLVGEVWQDVVLHEYFNGSRSYEISVTWPYVFSGDDTVTLGDGNDVFIDFDGSLTATLGAGDDVIHMYSPVQFDTDVKWVDAGQGNDQIYYQSGNGTIIGGAGNDSIGGEGNNDGVWTMNGGSGADLIYAFNGSRIVDTKGSNSDTYIGGYTDGVIVSYASGLLGITLDLTQGVAGGGGHGTDSLTGIMRIEGSRGNDTMLGGGFNAGNGVTGGCYLWGNQGEDAVTGAQYADYLWGGTGNDIVQGLVGDDFIYGGTGNDTLTGGGGADKLRGEAGEDDFVYQTLADSTLTIDGRDRIIGFEVGIDDIDLSALGLGSFSFIGTAGFSAARQVRYVQSGSDTAVLINAIGKYTAEMRIDIAGHHVLTADDFV